MYKKKFMTNECSQDDGKEQNERQFGHVERRNNDETIKKLGKIAKESAGKGKSKKGRWRLLDRAYKGDDDKDGWRAKI